MDRDMLFKTVLPITGMSVLMLAFIVGYERFCQRHTERAQEAFRNAIQAMVERFHLTYHPPSGPHDWPGATGSYRDHAIAFFVVSETESPMRTGLIVRFQRPLPQQALARLKARRRFIKRGRSLEIDTSARSDDAHLPPQTDTLVATLLEGAYEVKIESNKIVVTLETRKNSFFNYDMLTDPDRLITAAEIALDLAITLEAASI
jgi:hypothetical protein